MLSILSSPLTTFKPARSTTNNPKAFVKLFSNLFRQLLRELAPHKSNVPDAKHLIGRWYRKTSMQSKISLLPFKVIEGIGDKYIIVAHYKEK